MKNTPLTTLLGACAILTPRPEIPEFYGHGGSTRHTGGWGGTGMKPATAKARRRMAKASKKRNRR